MEDPRKVEEGFGHGGLDNEEEKRPKKEGKSNIDGEDIIKIEKEEASTTSLDQPEERKDEQPLMIKPKNQRVATLDVFRGLTIVVMYTCKWLCVCKMKEARKQNSKGEICNQKDHHKNIEASLLGNSIARDFDHQAETHCPIPWSFLHIHSIQMAMACTFSSPASGPLRKDAPNWCRAPFEPEGLLRLGHAERLKQWISMALCLLILAIILHFTDAIPINKQLYSFSYVCFTAGAAGIVFSAFYILVKNA
ncbi:hypothetical protein LguiA_016072 [Lonicera macranthoides]